MRTLCLNLRSLEINHNSKRLRLREARSASRYRACWISWSEEDSLERAMCGFDAAINTSIPESTSRFVMSTLKRWSSLETKLLRSIPIGQLEIALFLTSILQWKNGGMVSQRSKP